MTVNQLIEELTKLQERGFGKCKLKLHVPTYYIEDGDIRENHYCKEKAEDLVLDADLYVGDGSQYKNLVLPYAGFELCTKAKFEKDRKKWEKEMEED